MAQSMTSSGLPANIQHNFARVPNISKPRSTFDRSAPHKTTFSAGVWIPVFVDEILPGDTFKVDASMFARLLSPLSVPIYDNMYLDYIAIFCPHRLVWEHFINQMGEQPTGPSESIDYTTPIIDLPAGGIAVGDLADYFGLPVGAASESGAAVPLKISALPFRVYNLFINQWGIAQNVITGPTVINGDGPDPYNTYAVYNRMKRPDYFTSCQPATQKGSPVELPLGGSATVNAPAGSVAVDSIFNENISQPPWTGDTIGTQEVGGVNGVVYGNGIGTVPPDDGIAFSNSTGMPLAGQPLMTVNGADFTGPTINEMRLSIVTQQYLELDERSGTRYPEFVHAHFGVESSDARLQRVEFITAGTIPIMTHVVPQTTPVISGSSPQGNLAAYTSASGRCTFSHSFEEHGTLMVLVEVRADITYQQGVHRMWSRQTRYDYYDPLFANIGEQPVLNQEIYAQGTSADSEPFGYQEYAAEYRFGQGKVTGLMRNGVSGSVSVYNLALEFSGLPGLNATFLNDNPPISRVSAVSADDIFIFDSFWKVQCTRVMPTFSIPGLMRF